MTTEVEAAIARLETFAYERSLAGHDIDEIAPEIRTLISAYREAERDAARYRMLCEESVQYAMHMSAVLYAPQLVVPRGMLDDADVDAAIDAAIAKGGSHAG